MSPGIHGGDERWRQDFPRRLPWPERVLYFYPKTTRRLHQGSLLFSRQLRRLEKEGAVILGVSPDPVKSHDKFVKKYKLPFTLLADDERRSSTPTASGVRRFSGP